MLSSFKIKLLLVKYSGGGCSLIKANTRTICSMSSSLLWQNSNGNKNWSAGQISRGFYCTVLNRQVIPPHVNEANLAVTMCVPLVSAFGLGWATLPMRQEGTVLCVLSVPFLQSSAVLSADQGVGLVWFGVGFVMWILVNNHGKRSIKFLLKPPEKHGISVIFS